MDRASVSCRAALALAFLVSYASAASAQGAPGAPTNVQAAVSGNQVTVTWSPPASGGAPVSYTLLARTAPSATPVATLPIGAGLSFSAAAPNGTFLLSLTASNASGTSPESAPITVTIPRAVAPPGAPTALIGTVNGSTVAFSWAAPTSGGTPTTYVLQAGTTSGFVTPIVSLPIPASTTSVSVPGVFPGTYVVRLVAQNAGGVSSPSNEVSVTVAGAGAPGAPTLAASVAGSTVNVSWTPGAGGTPTSYILSASVTSGGPAIVTAPLGGTSAAFANVPDGTYYLRLTASNGEGTSPASNQVTVTLPAPLPITPLGSDIIGTETNFGASLALSADGTRLVVAATGSANGTTRVYQWTGGSWMQLGADIIGEASGDRAGTGVAINASGTRIAIGAYLNDGNGTSSGHVRVYDLVAGTWTQVGADIDGDSAGSGLGWRVALSATGNRLIAGAPRQNSIEGSARVFDLVGTTWTPVGGTLTGDYEFGDAVDISSDGNTIAISAPSAAGVGRPGTVQVYRLSAGHWTQVGNTLAGTGFGENFGDALSLTADGSRIAVAAPLNRDASPAGNRSFGAVRIFDLVGGTWAQVGSTVSGIDSGINAEQFGETLMISDDGTRFAATAASNSHARIFRLASGAWIQIGSNITPNGTAGRSEGLALSRDGRTVAVGYINGNPKRVSVLSIAP